ncbi:MAG: hypothetical protein P8184_16295 [Calditrichia bacterium]
MNRNLLILLVNILSVFFLTCEQNKTPLQTASVTKLTLSLEDVTCTEVWLRLTVEELSGQAAIRLLRNDSIVYNEPLNTGDTLLYDSGLLPNASYRYQALLTENGKPLSQSPVVSVQTMDTTSHEFQWETIEFPSPYGSATLYDVAIVNENDIWACGEIYSDSTQPWLPYNAVHWDGQQWELKRITVDYRGQPSLAPLRGVFCLPTNQIIFSSGLPYLPEGNGWKLYHLWDMGILNSNDGSVYKIWGTSLDDLYFAGLKGTIVHYNGSSWQKLESGTKVDLLDIWGSPDGSVVWACGYKDFVGTVLLKITGDEVDKLYEDYDHWYTIREDSISGVITSVWANHSDILWLVSPWGMYRAPANTRGEARRFALNAGSFPGFPQRLRGRAANDIFVAGDFSFIGHFNGLRWHHFTEFQGRIRFRSMALIQQTAVLVGTDLSTGEAVIVKAE